MSLAQSVELLAVVLAIAYLLLAARQNLWCWACAGVSSGIYTVLFWDVSLLMESMLNVFYLVMAGAGWWQWRYGSSSHSGLAISSLRPWQHGLIISAMLAAALLNGWLMARYTSAAWPFIDSFTTWAAVINTFLVVRKVLENWLYWLVIDGISIWLYIDRGLYLTALLYAAYVVMVVFAYLSWRRQYQQGLYAAAGTL